MNGPQKTVGLQCPLCGDLATSFAIPAQQMADGHWEPLAAVCRRHAIHPTIEASDPRVARMSARAIVRHIAVEDAFRNGREITSLRRLTIVRPKETGGFEFVAGNPEIDVRELEADPPIGNQSALFIQRLRYLAELARGLWPRWLKLSRVHGGTNIGQSRL